MSDLVERARQFATSAHQRIDHQRKYTNQPYHVHLEAVAKLVNSVTDDDEMIAAAWLHDTVEDTPATLGDIEENFGVAVAELVEDLTDISIPSDGNRASRKEMDCYHLAQSSVRAKTVKLADLIDNCKDITKHDERFSHVYLVEMGALLNVLGEADQTLYKEAQRLHAKHIARLGIREASPIDSDDETHHKIDLHGFDDKIFHRMFMEVFTARDIAEGLLSFDTHASCQQVSHDLDSHCCEVASVRISGAVQGYVRAPDLGKGKLEDCFRGFKKDQVINGAASFSDVIHVLGRHDHCFVTVLGNVAGVISRDDINKPMVRMWLFGIVTMIEMGLVKLIKELFPEDSWEQKMNDARLQKARDIHKERQRRNLYCDLIDCLQLSDKAQVLISDPKAMKRIGMGSKKTAKRAIKELESLRNHLAHAQDIVQHDWAQIARMSKRIEMSLLQ